MVESTWRPIEALTELVVSMFLHMGVPVWGLSKKDSTIVGPYWVCKLTTIIQSL